MSLQGGPMRDGAQDPPEQRIDALDGAQIPARAEPVVVSDRVGERQVQEAQRVRALPEAVDQPVDKLLLGGEM